MQRMIFVLLALCLISTAFANEDNVRRDAVPKNNTLYQMPSHLATGREGGETIATAVPIPGLPFSDTGYTCDNIHDYDVACSFTGSTSPDVVYSYVPPADELVQMDLCLSDYDTKIYVFDTAMNVVGCNDDFWYAAPCYVYSSYLEVFLTGGETYYIVVDGYGYSCGNYNLDMTSQPYVPIECNDNFLPEDEPYMGVDYDDTYNGGCNSSPYVFQPLYWIDEDSGCMHLSGISGWYPYQGSDYRDTDWFEFVADSDQITVSIMTDNDYTLTRCMMTTENPSCAGYSYSFQSSEIPANLTMSWTVDAIPGETYWVFVAPADWISGPLQFTYCLQICGLDYSIIPNEDKTWGDVKSMYE
jgi:hypothetical protein